MKNNSAIFDAYNYIPEGIFIIDHNFSVVFWNKALEDISNIKADQILEKNLLEFFPHLNKNIYKIRLENIFKGGAPEIFSAQIHKYIIPCKLSSGNFRAQHTVVTSMPSNEGSLSFAVFTIKDVSDEIKRINDYGVIYKKALHEIEQRKIAEQSLKESEEELKQLNTSKDKFFSIIAHDLRGPFSGLMGLSEVVLEDLDSMTKSELEEVFATISDSMNNIYDLLENLLNWSRIQLGHMDFNASTINLYKISDSVIKLLKEIAKQKNIELINNLDNNLYAIADENMINTVIRNLISNAVKFTPESGRVSISSKYESDKIVISVEDTGIGMTRDQMENIFKIDKHNTTVGTNNEKGTGLGLVLCKDLIEKNGGTLKVKSELGTGSTFCFSLNPVPN